MHSTLVSQLAVLAAAPHRTPVEWTIGVIVLCFCAVAAIWLVCRVIGEVRLARLLRKPITPRINEPKQH